jgi:hypothetical protein
MLTISKELLTEPGKQEKAFGEDSASGCLQSKHAGKEKTFMERRKRIALRVLFSLNLCAFMLMPCVP